MDANREQSSFWQFSDQLRLHTSNLSNLSIGDSIWSDPNSLNSSAPSDHTMGSWKSGFGTQKLAFGHSNFNRQNNNVNVDSGKTGNYFGSDSKTNGGPMNSYFNKTISKPAFGNGKRNGNYNNSDGNGKKKNNNSSNGNNSNGNSGGVDKRFKTLPPTEALPRSEAVGGYIFVCNNDTMQENLKRQLFGLPPRYRDSVRAITPGLPLFLYNYSTHQLHGIFEAASFGGTNIDPSAWEDKKSHGESRFPAQVKVMTRKNCEPLEEDSFRPILHHYDGPKFRLELSVPEALALLDIFAENNA